MCIRDRHTIEAFVEQLRLSLTQGDKVKIDGLGTFHITLTSDGTEVKKDCTVRSLSLIHISPQPAQAQETVPLNHSIALKGINGKDLQILIAEDNDSNYSLVKHILKEYQITRVVNGVEAVEKVRDEEFDIVLMDMKMPIMGGLEATRKIRELNPIIPIIALTANAFDADRVSAMEAGCNAFLTKPLKKEELLELFSFKL